MCPIFGDNSWGQIEGSPKGKAHNSGFPLANESGLCTNTGLSYSLAWLSLLMVIVCYSDKHKWDLQEPPKALSNHQISEHSQTWQEVSKWRPTKMVGFRLNQSKRVHCERDTRNPINHPGTAQITSQSLCRSFLGIFPIERCFQAASSQVHFNARLTRK